MLFVYFPEKVELTLLQCTNSFPIFLTFSIIDYCILNLRCLPGYPHKCPKIQIVPQNGLSKKDADRLLSLLVDQVGGLVV